MIVCKHGVIGCGCPGGGVIGVIGGGTSNDVIGAGRLTLPIATVAPVPGTCHTKSSLPASKTRSNTEADQLDEGASVLGVDSADVESLKSLFSDSFVNLLLLITSGLAFIAVVVIMCTTTHRRIILSQNGYGFSVGLPHSWQRTSQHDGITSNHVAPKLFHAKM